MQDPPWEEWTLLLNNSEIKQWSTMFALVQWPFLFLERDHKNPKYGECQLRPVILAFAPGWWEPHTGWGTLLSRNRDWWRSLLTVGHCQCSVSTFSEPWSGLLRSLYWAAGLESLSSWAISKGLLEGRLPSSPRMQPIGKTVTLNCLLCHIRPWGFKDVDFLGGRGSRSFKM